MKKSQPKSRAKTHPRKAKVQPEQPLNASLVALCAIAYWVLVEDAIETEEGRADLKGMFRQALIAVPEVQSTPEWHRAMGFIQAVNVTLGIQ